MDGGHALSVPRRARVWYDSSMENAEKARENRLRRKAERQGYKLEKSRRRDPDATDFGVYKLTPAKGMTEVLVIDHAELPSPN